jgi:hypothetical protein
MRSIASRLGRLEGAVQPRRHFIIFGGWGDVDIDDDAEKQRLRNEHGPIREDEFVVVTVRKVSHGGE